VYPTKRHDDGGASRSGGARRTVGHEHVGSKALTRINEVEGQIRSTTATRQI